MVGDGPLGRWDNLQSIELYTTPEDYPIWYTKAPVVFGSHVPVRYKYCAFAGGKLRYYEPVESERVFTPQVYPPLFSLPCFIIEILTSYYLIATHC